MIESEIQADIIKYLESSGYTVIRMNAGKGRHNQRLAPAGTPDLLVIGHGRLFWIEVKTLTGAVSEAQHKMHDYLRKNGQHVFICRSTYDVKKVVNLLNNA